MRIEISTDESDPECRAATVISDEPLPLRIGAGPHLLVDDWFVAESEKLARTTTQPKRRDAPLIEGRPDQGDRIAPGAVMHDPESGLFRMWNWKAGDSVRSELVHRASDSPSRWPEAGETVFSFDGFGSKLIDAAPYCGDELRRFRLGYFNYEAPMGTYVRLLSRRYRLAALRGQPRAPLLPDREPPVGRRGW